VAAAGARSSQPIWTSVLAPVLAAFSFLYLAVVLVRPWLYRLGVLPSDSSGAFVVSIGNIQAGGTGKTPFTAFLVKRWRESLRLGIVSRGYRRTSKGSHRVRPDEEGAALKFGDEPTWFAQTFRDVPVQVGERRVAAAQDLVASEGTKLILLDDGFQHMALRRSFDFVLVDASAPRWHWRLLPWGRLREPGQALRRADAVILTKTESFNDRELGEFEKQLGRWAGSKVPILRFRQWLDWQSRVEEKLVLAAGLANPESFFAMVDKHPSKPQIQKRFSFADHHLYSPKDVEVLIASAREAGVRRVLVTEKDAVKLRALWPETGDNAVELVVSRLEVRPARESDEEQLERLDEIILGQVRGKAGAGVKLSRRKLTT
jgi:tetraacyldisaccharide 4'-kinase